MNQYEVGQIIKYQDGDEKLTFGICLNPRATSMRVFSERRYGHHISLTDTCVEIVSSLDEIPELSTGTFTKANREDFIQNAEAMQARVIAGKTPIEE